MSKNDFKTVHKMNVRGLNLAYRISPSFEGHKTKGIIFLLHGFMDHSGTWNDIVGLLPPGFIYIAVDFRGHGDSDWIPSSVSSYFYTEYILDIVVFIKQISEEIQRILDCQKTSYSDLVIEKYFGGKLNSESIGRFKRPILKFIFGHSLGGLIGLSAATVPTYYHIDGVVSLESSLLTGQTDRDISKAEKSVYDWTINRNLSATDKKRFYESREDAVDRLVKAHISYNPEVAEKIADENVKKIGQLYTFKFDHRLSFHSTLNSIPHSFVSQLWKRLKGPLLIITATNGRVDSESWNKQKAFIEENYEGKYEHRVVEGGHHCHLEESSLGQIIHTFNEFINNFEGKLVYAASKI